MLRVGAARRRLPMETGRTMAGYINRTGVATGVHDDLMARACVIDDGAERLCLVVLDVVCIDAAFVAEVREQIAAACQCKPHGILIAATHTHSSFGGVSRFSLDSSAAKYLGEYDPVLARTVQMLVVDAVAAAEASLTPVTLYAGTGHAPDVARNRTQAEGPYDPDVPLFLAIDRQGTVRAGIFSYASHSTVLGPANTLYSGDLIGLACRRLEAHWEQATVLGLAGAAGNISTRFTRRDASLTEAIRLGESLAGAVLDASRIPINTAPLRASQIILQLRLKPAENRSALEQRLTAARERLVMRPAQPDVPETRVLQAEIEGLEVALSAQQQGQSEIEAEVQLFQVGGAFIISFPGEMFVEYGLALRKALAPAHVLVAGYANDYIGYVPTPAAGYGYETQMSLLAPDSGTQLVAAASVLAGRENSAGPS